MITIVPLQVLNVFSAATNGSILLQGGDNINGDAVSQDAQLISPFGFCSKPSLPTPGAGTAAEMITIQGLGSRDMVIGGRDIRTQAIYGNLAAGESCMFASGSDGNGQARALAKADGSMTLYTTDTNTAAGNGVYFTVTPTGFNFVAPWGTMVFDATGFHITHMNGASINLGSINGAPPPLAALSSFVSITAGTFTSDCPITNLGVSSGVSFPCSIPIQPMAIPGAPLPPFATTVSSCVNINI